MSRRNFTVLENNPETVNHLAHNLGLSKKISFYDVYSLHDEDLLSFIPRPVYALLTIIPMTKTWGANRASEDESIPEYSESGPDERVLWFKQTISNGCGSIGMLHCVGSGLVRDNVEPDSDLDKLLKEAVPLKMAERAELLNQSDALYEAHELAAAMGDTKAPRLGADEHVGQHFVAFVKGKDGHLWELEGNRKGPLDRGLLAEDEDALSAKAIELGLGRVIDTERANGGDLRFSCIALAPSLG